MITIPIPPRNYNPPWLGPYYFGSRLRWTLGLRARLDSTRRYVNERLAWARPSGQIVGYFPILPGPETLASWNAVQWPAREGA